MSVDLERLKRETSDLAKQFRRANQNDLADSLDINARDFGVKAKIAAGRGLETFTPQAPESDSSTPTMDVVFGCRFDQIAHSADEINAETKAFVGLLTQGIFQRFPTSLEHIYTAYPEGRITMGSLNITGQSGPELEVELDGVADVQPDFDARHMLHSDRFETTVDPNYRTAMLRVKDTGLIGTPTTDQLYERAAWLGLDLCLSAVGPHQRLKDTDQPLNDVYWIAMKQIPDRDGDPDVFGLDRSEDVRWLYGRWARPGNRWNPGSQIVFSVPQVNLKP